MQRTPLVAANWKMNLTLDQGEVLLSDLLRYPSYGGACDIWIFPTAPLLPTLSRRVTELRSQLKVGAQDVSGHESGAYTGEVSAAILKSAGAHAVIIGHSERRQYHQESDILIANKMMRAVQNDLQAVLCIGERLADREAGSAAEVVGAQLVAALEGVDINKLSNVVIAYEPVWAIGTGHTASPEQVQEMHAFIRQVLSERYAAEVADGTRILYGGSVKPHNAEALFALPDVDGGLIGGASLKAESFMQIASAAT